MNQADMNLDARKNLSAGIDGELTRQELRFMLRRLDHDASLQKAWVNYHLARDGLRHQLPAMASSGFAARVMQAIEHESMPAASPARRGHWLRWSAGGAIAASVAAVALMIGQPMGDAEQSAINAPHQASAFASATRQPAPTKASGMPAVVPPWLSGNAAGLLSQRASFGEDQSSYPGRIAAYPSLRRYRTLDNNDGTYLLLLNQQPSAESGVPQQAAMSAQ
ncbi:MAG: anti-anti-sigma factor [Rhodanobacter sp.]|nr:MAG: anti-anti-sigma factor [Rhodanobacter sp.]